MTTRYTKDHEWVRQEGDVAVIGITDYAQSQLGDVVYVELPEIGRAVERGKEAAVVESAKAASEVYAPVSGEIVAVNDELSQLDDVNCWIGRSQFSADTGLSASIDEFRIYDVALTTEQVALSFASGPEPAFL